jgi:hypothetical protein
MSQPSDDFRQRYLVDETERLMQERAGAPPRPAFFARPNYVSPSYVGTNYVSPSYVSTNYASEADQQEAFTKELQRRLAERDEEMS